MSEDTISRHAAITLPVMPKEHREYQTINLDDAYEQGWNDLQKCIESLPSAQPELLDEWCTDCKEYDKDKHCCPRWNRVIRTTLKDMKEEQPEIIRCKDCKHWIRQTNYQGAPLSFGFCKSEDMWASLYGETTEVEHIDTDDNHYCGYAERRTDERTD